MTTLGEAFLRQRRFSVGDDKKLVNLPARPISASNLRNAAPYGVSCPLPVLNAMFKLLRLDPIVHKSMEWVVGDCLETLEKEGILLKFQGEDIYLYDEFTQETKTNVPTLEHYKEFAAKLVEVHTEKAKRRGDAYHKLQDIVYSAVMQASDMHHVLTPELLESALSLLEVDVFTESYLIPRVRQAIEEAWIQHAPNKNFKTGGKVFFNSSEDGKIFTGREFLDVDNLLLQLAHDRVNFQKKISPTGVLICVECECNLADVSCLSCRDAMCNSCFSMTHSTGGRLLHSAIFIEQIVCAECEGIAATLRCKACADCFCSSCFASCHQAGKRLRHSVSLTELLPCNECVSTSATILCKECNDLFCLKCFQKSHRRGVRQGHEPISLNSATSNSTLLAGNISNLLTTFEKSMKSQFVITPWHKFVDPIINKNFWYSFHSKEFIHQDVLPKEKWTTQMADLLIAQSAQHAAQGTLFVVAPNTTLAVQQQNTNKKPQTDQAFAQNGANSNERIDSYERLLGVDHYHKPDVLRDFELAPASNSAPSASIHFNIPPGPFGIVNAKNSNNNINNHEDRPSSASGFTKLKTIL
eukprot:GDKJ01058501.1.p1 GENE.GDKJ01058501.1~~GDKJ01058501.1.p1  ORF type:complete len:583 (+),score=95.16 GDKJ01058501.1:28-1776(+)